MTDQLSALIEESSRKKDLYKPIFFRLKNPEDKASFQHLIRNQAGLQVHDEILGQVEELIKSKNPKTVYKGDRLQLEAKEFLYQFIPHEYGVWVFYPWNNKLLHILDEEDFLEIRTNRNQYKITPDEKAVLSKKVIGVIGLSVGQSIAMTIAMERICGELRIADFDKLELSNFNRIRTPLHNLDISKVVAVAREIAEIDPFLKVTCYPQGLTEQNMDIFFLDGGKMDLCVEVCDGLDIKILSRLRAKELRIPVVMNTSDRGMTDVERFDLNPKLSILHGLVDHLDLSKVKEAHTNEEKVPYILPMLGLDTASAKLKASMLEIGESICTWPQLASAVALGGAVTTEVARRILLNEFHQSGRFFLDLEDVFKDEEQSIIIPEITFKHELDEIEMDKIVSSIYEHDNSDQVELDKSIIEDLLEAAILAPSGGNSQPWKWLSKNKNLYLFLDPKRSGSLLDYNNYGSFLGLGAATENLILKAHSLNFEVGIEQFPLGNKNPLTCIFRFFNKSNLSNVQNHTWDPLVLQIYKRNTNRNPGISRQIDTNSLESLNSIASSIPGASFHFTNDPTKIEILTSIIAASDKIRLMNPRGHKDFVEEIRWTPEENISTQDGFDLATIDLTILEDTGFKIGKEWKVIDFLKKWKQGNGLEKYSKRIVPATSGIGLITMDDNSINSFFDGGRAVERFWLEASRLKISVHPFTGSIYLFQRLLDLQESELGEPTRQDLQKFKSKLYDVFSINSNLNCIFLFRLFYSEEPKIKSLRRPVDKVLFYR